jgi:GGDEF domain-containing protein
MSLLNGDEFTILLTDLDRPEVAGALAQKLVTVIGQPFMLDGQRFETGASIGTGPYPGTGKRSRALVLRADAAMCLAKTQRRNPYHFLDSALDVPV